MKWQWQYSLLILPLLISSQIIASPNPSVPKSQKIIHFILFNYDNLIADHYSSTHSYLDNLVRLLGMYTNHSEVDVRRVLDSAHIAGVSNPVLYMMAVNGALKKASYPTFIEE